MNCCFFLLQVYPASKMSAFLMAGLTSKNAKQRAECLDELCFLVRGSGSSVLQPQVAQNVKEIAKQIADRDNGARNAALNCVAEIYFQVNCSFETLQAFFLMIHITGWR
jgi:cytoskeleton-associated protein 5